MSFILDALRKSEHARQQQTGPGLAEVPVVPARPRSNVWAMAAIALLIVNLVGVGVLLVHRANKDEAAQATVAVAAPASAPVASPAPATSIADSTAASLAASSPAPAAAAPTPSPAAPASAVPAPLATVRNPLAEEVDDGPAGLDPTLAAGAAKVPAGPPAVTARAGSGAARRGSVVYAPIPEASDLPSAPAPAATRASPPAQDTMPNADELAARGTVPALHLDLHVYSPSPQQRFIFVNSRKYREGETLQEGPVVEQITADGAVLSYGGNRFKLTSD
jgi:general secretion pathway protein B